MHTVSDLWRQLLADPMHATEVKLRIAGVEYGADKIVRRSLAVYGGLYSTFGIGNCCARQIDFEVIPQGTIPRQAKIEVFARLTLGEQASEWISKGVFFFSTRKTDRVTGVLSVHGYDAMLKAEETWLDSSYDAKTWPMPAATAVADIAQRMGVEVDSRNEKVGKKIREATLEKIPYMLVVGDRDMEAGTVSVRTRTGEDLGAMALEDFSAKLRQIVDEKQKI